MISDYTILTHTVSDTVTAAAGYGVVEEGYWLLKTGTNWLLK